jgi:pimeloyl-ACP methyl ester carboxylesterase
MGEVYVGAEYHPRPSERNEAPVFTTCESRYTIHSSSHRSATHAKYRSIDDASHYIQIDRPDVVVGAVRRVVTQVRQPR